MSDQLGDAGIAEIRSWFEPASRVPLTIPKYVMRGALALLDRIAALERELAEARNENHDLAVIVERLRAEVEAARKNGFIAGRHMMGLLHDDLTPMTDDEAYAAWSRYQQERKG